MVKIIVEIDLYNHTKDSIGEDWFPIKERPYFISVDKAYMEKDPTENSFYIFKLIKMEE